MSSLVALRTAIVSDFVAEITDAKTVAPYGGRLNLGEVQRITKRAPAVLVALVNGGSSETRPAEDIRVDMQIAAFVIAEDQRGKDRDVVALAIAEQVVIRVAAWNWRGPAKASQPTDLKVESLYSGDLDRRGIALLAVAWKQTVPIGVDRFEAERANLPDFADPQGLGISGAVYGSDDPEAAS